MHLQQTRIASVRRPPGVGAVAELDGVLYKEIVEQGLREFPNECCGLIAAAGGVPTKVFTMTNADASPVT